MTRTLVKAAASAALAVAAITAQAQPATSTAPANVGVSQGTAAEAASKAVPRSDTGTLVRTGPTAGARAGAAADNTRAAVGTSNDATTSGAAPAPMAPMQRPAKADRN